jgi:hypothetical protein
VKVNCSKNPDCNFCFTFQDDSTSDPIPTSFMPTNYTNNIDSFLITTPDILSPNRSYSVQFWICRENKENFGELENVSLQIETPEVGK